MLDDGDRTTVDLPAGGTTCSGAVVRAAALWQYSGYITAAAASGGSVHTPVGFLMDVERYDVTVNSLVLLS